MSEVEGLAPLWAPCAPPSMDDPPSAMEHDSPWRMLSRHGVRFFAIRIAVVALPIAVCFAVQMASSITGVSYAVRFGIFPRQVDGLFGILTWSFLHFSWGHLLGNASFLFVLGVMVAIRGIVDFCLVWLLAQFVGGLGTWCTGGAHTVHAGASGVIMGLFGCILLRVVFERSLVALFWAAVVAVFYGSLFYIILPTDAYSWQGHLWGLLGGVLAAALLGCYTHRRQRVERERNQIGSGDVALSPFDDFELERGAGKFTDQDAMFAVVDKELHAAPGTAYDKL